MTDDRGDVGRHGEEIAVSYLVENGYRILGRNITFKVGEIDIVAEKDDVLCFVEVRTRSDTLQGHPACFLEFHPRCHW